MRKNKIKNINQRGAVTIVLTLLILNGLMVIGLGVSTLMLAQIKTSRQAGQSVVAFYAADAGAEKCLYEVRKNGAASCPFTLDFSSGATYTTTYNGSDTITSTGYFKSTSRKIELTW